MACERYREALTDLAAGGLAVPELEAHLETCVGCREELDGLRRALDAVDAELGVLASVEPSPALAARIRQASTELDAGVAWRPSFVFGALAALLIGAVTLVLLRGREPAPASVASASPRPPQREATPTPARPAPEMAAGPQAALSARPIEVLPRNAAARSAPEPEVLVPPGGAEALVRLVARLQRENLAPPVMGVAGEPSPDLSVPDSIEVASVDIQPLEIVPLDPAESSGT